MSSIERATFLRRLRSEPPEHAIQPGEVLNMYAPQKRDWMLPPNVDAHHPALHFDFETRTWYGYVALEHTVILQHELTTQETSGRRLAHVSRRSVELKTV